MDKIRIGDTVKFSYNTTPRMYLIVNNRSDINMRTQCVVEDVLDGNAVIYAQSDEESRLVIPTKYLVKVDSEAREPKYKRGQWVEMPDGDVAVITKVDYRSSHPYSLFSVKKEDVYYDLWRDDDLKPYTGPKELVETGLDGVSEETANALANAIKKNSDTVKLSWLAAFNNTVNSYRELSDDEKPQAIMIDKWEQYTADLAKEIVLKIAGSQLHNHKTQEIGRIAVEIAKSVVENLKESEG